MKGQINNISIIGMGALGILYGDFFVNALGRQAVTFIADSKRIARYRQEGVYSNGRLCDFMMKTGEEMSEPADLLIVAVKATALGQAINSVRNQIGQNTIIISVLNGITSEEVLGEAFGKEHILYCVAQGMDAVKLGNELKYANMGQLCIGRLPEEEEKEPMLQRLIDLFNRTGMAHTVESDIRSRIWSKWMLNVGVNQVVMVKEGTYGTVQAPGEAREMMKAAMKEVIALAEYENVTVSSKEMDNYIALIDSLDPDLMPSMRQDGLARRPSEVDFFSGTVIKKAEKYGLHVPVNRALYRRIKEMEATYS